MFTETNVQLKILYDLVSKLSENLSSEEKLKYSHESFRLITINEYNQRLRLPKLNIQYIGDI